MSCLPGRTSDIVSQDQDNFTDISKQNIISDI